MKKYIKIVFLVSLISYVSTANSFPDLSAYGRLEQVTGVSISPNGNLIAYRRTKSDEDDHVIVYSIKDRQVISALKVQKINPQGHYFANDDFLILIGSNHLNLRGYESSFDVNTAFSLDIKKNKIEQLVKLGEPIGSEKRVVLGQTGIANVVGKSPDGKKVYIPAFVSESSADATPNYSLLSVNINGKGRPRVESKGTEHTQNYFMDKKGRVLARENLNDRTNVHSIDVLDKRRWRTLYRYESKIVTHSFVGLNDDFSALVFTRSDDDEGYLELSLGDGSVTAVGAFDATRDTSGLLTNEHGVVIGSRYTGLMPDYQILNSKVHGRVQEILSQYQGHSVYLTDWTPDWKHIVVRVEGTLSAGDYFLFSEGKKPALLVNSRFDIGLDDLNPIATTRYKARDGLMIPVILTIPRSSAESLKNLPAVLMPHGGPASHDQIGFDYMAQAFASRGYLVIQPQFRGSTGFGQTHYEAGWGQWGKGMQDDLTDAVKTLSKQGIIAPDRVCIVGASYGGYAALAGAAFTPDLYRCAVSIAGVSHLPKMLAADKKRYGRKSWVLDYWNRSILAGDYNKDTLQTLSPYYSAATIKIPVLLLHGEDDTVVEYEQSVLMNRAMKKENGDVRLVKLKNDDHYLQSGETRIQAVEEMVEFVEKHIGT